jgi:hypothetical protein
MGCSVCAGRSGRAPACTTDSGSAARAPGGRRSATWTVWWARELGRPPGSRVLDAGSTAPRPPLARPPDPSAERRRATTVHEPHPAASSVNYADLTDHLGRRALGVSVCVPYQVPIRPHRTARGPPRSPRHSWRAIGTDGVVHGSEEPFKQRVAGSIPARLMRKVAHLAVSPVPQRAGVSVSVSVAGSSSPVFRRAG